MNLKVKGIWKVSKDNIRIVLNMDFCSYYRWLFMKGTYNLHKMQLPKHSGHINVISPKIHNVDCSPFLYLNNRVVWISYGVEGNFGGFSKGFKNFWLDAEVPEADNILDFYGFKKQEGFSRIHITVCNNKSDLKNP